MRKVYLILLGMILAPTLAWGLSSTVYRLNGNYGIATTTPAYILDVYGNSRVDGTLKIGAYTLPATDGSADQYLKTNGSGAVAWGTVAGGGDITQVFDCATGDCNTMTVGTSEYLTYGTGYIDANRFAGVTTVSGTEFGYLNDVTSAIQTQFSGKQGTLTNSAGLRGALSDESGAGVAIFAGGAIGAGTATTPSANDSDTSIATTAYVQGEINGAGGTGLTCSSGTCNVDLGTSIDMSSETNITAGRSLTESGDSILADSELYTDTKCIYWEDNLATDDFQSVWFAEKAVTITRLWCESDQTVNMTIMEDDGTPADIETTDLVCDSTPANQTSGFEDAAIAAGSRIDLAVESVSGTPTWCSFCWSFTYDD